MDAEAVKSAVVSWKGGALVVALRISFFVAQPVDKHLLFGFVVGHEQVANASSADKVADFFGEVLGVVAGSLERLGHEDNLKAGVQHDILWIFNVPQKNKIAGDDPFRRRRGVRRLPS